MSPDALVFWGAALGTFVASVMADDQSQRLRNGAFGTVAGASLGGFAALFENNDKLLVLWGVLGSAIGASVAWLVYLILAFVAQKPAGRRMLEYQFKGLTGVHQQLIADQGTKLQDALDLWGTNFARTITQDKDRLIDQGKSESVNISIQRVIQNWLSTIVNTFNLVLATIADNPDYRCRATLILFGCDDQGNCKGCHWISFAGHLPEHQTARPFDTKSQAYKVLSEDLQSPCFIAHDDKKDNKGQERESSNRYASFILIRVNERAVLSVDWPGKHEENDPYVHIVRDLFYLEVAPAVNELMNIWHGHLEKEEIGLNKLGPAVPAQPPPSRQAEPPASDSELLIRARWPQADL